MDIGGFIGFGRNNQIFRQKWLKNALASVHNGSSILDAGAGQLRNRIHCKHLKYMSQDFCQYEGIGDGVALQTGTWDTSHIDLVCDIVSIPLPDETFDVILCSEVLEHVPDPALALKELSRLLNPSGILLLTAPFCSLTHHSPYHYTSGFNKYWYKYHLDCLGYEIEEIVANGNWFSFITQELYRLPTVYHGFWGRVIGSFGLILALPLISILFFLSKLSDTSDLLCFGYHVKARKKSSNPMA